LASWAAAVEQDKGSCPVGDDPQFAQVGQIAQTTTPSLTEEFVGSLGADPWHTQKIMPGGSVHLDRGMSQMLSRPGQLGVAF
jgi:hypothetical protein